MHSPPNQNPRSLSFFTTRAFSVSGAETPGGVSPTYKSTIFSHLPSPMSPLNLSIVRRNSQQAQSNGISNESETPRFSKDSPLSKISQVLPTVAEWIPQRGQINDPEFYNKVEEEAILQAKKQAEQAQNELREKKEKLNKESRDLARSLHEKHQTRLDHKKPKEADLQKAKAETAEFSKQMAQRLEKIAKEKEKLKKSFCQQIEDSTKRKQNNIKDMKAFSKTSLEFKPRKRYDLEEYRKGLKKQVEEKSQKNMAQKSKQEEIQKRIKCLQEAESTISAYRQKLALRKMLSPKAGMKHEIYSLQSINSRILTEETQVSEVSPAKEEKSCMRSNSKSRITKRVSFADISETCQYEINSRLEIRASVELTLPSSPTLSSPIKTEGCPETKFDWELASQSLMEKKEQQERYLRNLKEQILIKKKSKEMDSLKDKQEEKNLGGLNLGQKRSSESTLKAAEVIKKQMAEKEGIKSSKILEKKEEAAKIKEQQKADELAMRQRFEEIHEQKKQILTQYKKNLADSLLTKKYQGLRTIKI